MRTTRCTPPTVLTRFVIRHFVVIGLYLVVMAGCSPFGLVDNSSTTATSLDPEVIKNQRGVLALYNSSVKALAGVMAGSMKTPDGIDKGTTPSFARWVGHISDELDYRTSTTAQGDYVTYTYLNLSTRNFDFDPTGGDYHNFFDRLSDLRNFAGQTQTGLRVYGALLSDTLLAHAMTIEATALIMSAELYCSGVPLSRLDFNGDIVLTRGYSTEELFTFALAKLDSAGPYATGNARITGLIDVLRIRVLLGLGKIQDAVAIAQRVETPFQYQLTYAKVSADSTSSAAEYHGKFTVAGVKWGTIDRGERISDRKGSNGLPYASSHDPRVTLPALSDPWAPFVMASGVEARLAEAEAALQREDPSWLSILNALRTSCTTADACPSPAPAGTGGVPGLGVLHDPGDSASRLNMLFEERAYWLFLRGFRQGDLRRRIRTYGGTFETLYPIGFPEVGTTAYGSMISLPVPLREQRLNPHYKGCLHNDA